MDLCQGKQSPEQDWQPHMDSDAFQADAAVRWLHYKSRKAALAADLITVRKISTLPDHSLKFYLPNSGRLHQQPTCKRLPGTRACKQRNIQNLQHINNKNLTRMGAVGFCVRENITRTRMATARGVCCLAGRRGFHDSWTVQLFRALL